MYNFLILSPKCHLTAIGPDAFPFLQSQFSNDLRAATAENPVYGFWLDRKGRIRGDSLIFRDGEESLSIVSRHTPADFLQEFLEEKIIADEIELEEAPGPYQLVSIWPAESLPQITDSPAPFRDPTLPLSGFSWFIPQEQVSSVTSSLSGTQVDQETYERNLLLARRVRIPADLAVDVFPQELGLEDYVHYNKGCFLGQEIMARLHYQGRTRRFLKVFHTTPQKSLPEPGSPLLVAGKKTGVVLRALYNQTNAAALIAIGNWGERIDPIEALDSQEHPWISVPDGLI